MTGLKTILHRMPAITLFFYPLTLLADQWSFPAEVKKESFALGDLVIERVVDTTMNSRHPSYQIKVYREGKELANYRNLTFDFIQPLDRGNFIFAGTNSGLSRFAYFVLDKDGGLLLAKVHSDSIPYCKITPSLIREWLPKALEIREEYKEVSYESGETIRYFSGAQVKTCNGTYLDIFE